MWNDTDFLSAFRRRLANEAIFRTGWTAFDTRMRSSGPESHNQACAAREVLRQRHAHKVSHTYPNFLRFQVRAAAELAFHHACAEYLPSASAAMEKISWLMEEPHWYSQAPTNGWASDLWTADDVAAVSMAMDFLPLNEAIYDSWRHLLMERGVEPLWRDWVDPCTRIHVLDSMGHNWWAVCVAATGLGLLAVQNLDPSVEERLEQVANSLKTFFAYPGNVLQNKRPTFGSDGAFLESVGYLDYTLPHVAAFCSVMKRRLGRDLAAELTNLPHLCDYCLSMLQPLRDGLQRLSFGDMTDGPGSMGAYMHQPAAVLLWLARTCCREDLFHLARRIHAEPREAAEFLYWPGDLRGDSFEGAPGDMVFNSIGVAVLRDGYSDRATVLAMKTGETWNHNHSDVGSFILSASGIPFFIDPGTTEYGSPLHEGYFKTSAAHNVVCHVGRGQVTDLDVVGTRFPGRILNPFFAPDYKYFVAEATGPWEGVYRRFHRHVLWLGHWMLLVDDLMAWSQAEWESLFHYEGEGEAVDGGFAIRNGEERLTVHVVGPAGWSLDLHRGYRSRQIPCQHKLEYEQKEVPYLGVRFPGRSTEEQMMYVFRLPGAEDGHVESFDHSEGLGAKLVDGDGVWEILCNRSAAGRAMHANSWIEQNGIKTDGFLTLRHRNHKGLIDRVAVHNGSRVSDADQIYFSALMKSDMLWAWDPGGLVLHGRFPQDTQVWLTATEGTTLVPRNMPAEFSTLNLSGVGRP